MASTSGETLNIKLAFGGGTELLLAPPRSKKQTIQIPKVIPLSQHAAINEPSITSPEAQTTKSTLAATDTSAGKPSDMRYLVKFIRENLIVEREELFVDADGEGVRPGILVLINDADWELEGELDYTLEDGDEICFISTLHGG
ncbi:unnamed protein product [Sympodiomycopsis kandeliae]